MTTQPASETLRAQSPASVLDGNRSAEAAPTSAAARFLSNEQIVLEARRHLPQGVWDYLVGGSESETTLRRNRLAFDRWAFRPRILRDVSKIDTSTTLLGQPLRIPVILAPVGALELFTPEGAAASAQAAEEFGTLEVVSSASQPGIEDSAAASARPKVYQLYIRGDDDWLLDSLRRIKASAYHAFCLTVDVAIYSRRERPMLSGYTLPTQRGTRAAVAQRQLYGAMMTWEQMARIKEIVDLPFMVKGIATPEDAEIAVQHGVDVIWVSNHGGRQLDSELGTIDLLPEIVQAVGGRAEIVVDGGVQRGSDVIKAVCLGAKAVAIGKLQGWGLAAAGKDGLVRVLELLEHEMISAMGLLGVTSIDGLGMEYLRRADPVIPAHEMSMWVNMPGGRIL
jgi:isopentenyl diphosphate isomerase/L-lactate dehydrogenase-like FMN-dependent dehydrogenase